MGRGGRRGRRLSGFAAFFPRKKIIYRENGQSKIRTLT